MSTDTRARLARFQSYRRTVAKRYRSLVESELSQLPEGPVHVSPKVDGELWFVDACQGKVSLKSHSGRTLDESAPVLSELRATLGGSLQDTIIAGELFALGGEGRPRVGDVAHAMGPDGDLKRLGFLAFDLVSDEGVAPPEDYGERLTRLETLLSGGKRAKTMKTVVVTRADVQGLYLDLVTSGKAEGLVVRTSDGRVFKVKPALHLDCAVLGFTRRQADHGQVRSVLLGLERPDGSMQLVGACGNLGDDDARRALLSRLAPTVIQSAFRKVSSSGALYQLCKPEIVMEIVVSDVQSEDSQGAAIRQWALNFDDIEGWSALAPVAGVSLIHPRIERLREDKAAKGLDVRIGQLDERCLTPGVDEPAQARTLPESTSVRREVYTKASKGKTAVRKLLVWKTNKETLDPAYPAYVVHFSDYSPGRSTALKREVRLAPDEASARSIADDLIAKNIKRGWKPV